DDEADQAAPEEPHRREAAQIDIHAAEYVVYHRIEGDKRQDGGGDEALIERAHDVVGGAELHEEGADDRGDDAGAANGKRQHHASELVGVRQYDGREHHGGDRGHHIGLEQIGSHAGAVADIVADIVGDGGGVARI